MDIHTITLANSSNCITLDNDTLYDNSYMWRIIKSIHFNVVKPNALDIELLNVILYYGKSVKHNEIGYQLQIRPDKCNIALEYHISCSCFINASDSDDTIAIETMELFFNNCIRRACSLFEIELIEYELECASKYYKKQTSPTICKINKFKFDNTGKNAKHYAHEKFASEKEALINAYSDDECDWFQVFLWTGEEYPCDVYVVKNKKEKV